jgi:hypothetical protein
MTTTDNLGLTPPTVGGDSDIWGNELNTDLDLIDAFAGRLTTGAMVDVASGTTCDIGAAANTVVRITGTAAISNFGTVANTIRFVTFAGALQLNVSGVLYLLGGVDRKTTAGDWGIYKSDATGNWVEVAYFPVANDPSCANFQTRWNQKTSVTTTNTTYFQIPVSLDNFRQSAKISISCGTDDAASGYSSEYSEWVLDYGSYGGSYHTPAATRNVQVQNSVSGSTNQISATVTGSISSNTLSIKIALSFGGAVPSTTGRVNAKCELLGPGKSALISAV